MLLMLRRGDAGALDLGEEHAREVHVVDVARLAKAVQACIGPRGALADGGRLLADLGDQDFDRIGDQRRDRGTAKVLSFSSSVCTELVFSITVGFLSSMVCLLPFQAISGRLDPCRYPILLVSRFDGFTAHGACGNLNGFDHLGVPGAAAKIPAERVANIGDRSGWVSHRAALWRT